MAWGDCVCSLPLNSAGATSAGISAGTGGGSAAASGGTGGGNVGGSGANTACSVATFEYDVQDAAYSHAFDRIALISTSPQAFHWYDPLKNVEESTIALDAVPIALAISPNGKTAAVGFDRSVALIDLQMPALIDEQPMSSKTAHLALSDDAFAYVFPAGNALDAIHSVDLRSGVEATADARQWDGLWGVVHPSNSALYSIAEPLNALPSLNLYDITAGAPKVGRAVASFNDGRCLPLWLRPDGSQLFTGCGQVLRIAPFQDQDGTPLGMLELEPSADFLQAIAATDAAVYAISRPNEFYESNGVRGINNDTHVSVYDAAWHIDHTITIPCFAQGSASSASHARYLFASADGSALFAIVNAEDRFGAPPPVGIVRVQ